MRMFVRAQPPLWTRCRSGFCSIPVEGTSEDLASFKDVLPQLQGGHSGPFLEEHVPAVVLPAWGSLLPINCQGRLLLLWLFLALH